MVARAVTRLTLSHFRSYKFATLEADACPQVLFGDNGAGKTNLLEALSLFSPGRGLRRARADDMSRAPEALGWKIRGTLSQDTGSDEPAHEIETWAEAGARRSVAIDEKSASQLSLAKHLRVIWLVPVMDRLWLEGAADRRQFIDRVAMSLYPTHAEAALGYEKAMRERNRLLKDQIGDPSWYKALEETMARFGADIISGRANTLTRLAAAQAGAARNFPHADLEMMPTDGDTAVSADELVVAFAQGRSRDMAAGRTLIGPHRADLHAVYADKNVQARLCSTGEQKALLVSLILANARAIHADTGAPPLLLLDEVAAHLDEGRRHALYDEICTLNAQAWMTGTGAELFDGLKKRAQFWTIEENELGTAIEPAAP